jgi:hypothetical protein
MKILQMCNFHGCESQELSFYPYNGKQFCQNHYNENFLAELGVHYKAWDGLTAPSDRLKYLIGRYYAEHELPLIGKPSLTKAIVHDRSYGWKKTENGVIFTALRYPVNRRLGSPYCDELHQTWEFNLMTLNFTFLSEEKK